jgi:hypothetical protein
MTQCFWTGDQKFKERKWGIKKNLNCLRTKQLGERDKITLPMNIEKSHKKGGERIS